MIVYEDQLFNCVCNIENLYNAWVKAKNVYDHENDFVFNRREISEYEANLQQNLEALSVRLKDNNYEMTPMLPMPLPKTKDGAIVSRQHFHVALEDQIVWLAVINILGPLLDDQMPYWSFGNRLYMPIWKEKEENGAKKVTKFGRYKPSSHKIYRSWSSSWPLFRKAVSVTAKKMLCKGNDYLDEDDLEEIDTYSSAPDSFRIQTWFDNYWNKRQPQDKDVYYATIDLEKFYPSIDIKRGFLNETVLRIIQIDPGQREQSQLYCLLDKLLSFKLSSQYDHEIDTTTVVEGDRLGDDFGGLPTGLFVAGFLSNVAMMEVDREVYRLIEENRRIAHFRFVDDHVFLAYSVEELREWVLRYGEIVSQHLQRVKINREKIEPEAFRAYMANKSDASNDRITAENVAEQCRLDPTIASPFSSLTLKKLSGLNRDPFELMDESEKIGLLRDIEHILIAEFPETEIRKDTRVSWAAMLLSRLVPEINIDHESLANCGKLMAEMPDDTTVRAEFKALEKAISSNQDKFNQRIFSLLLKALKDNIGKPKIWRRCVSFCRTTGYNGIRILLNQLKEDIKLSDNGKNYIFASIISEAASGLLTCVNIQKLDRYTYYEKKRAMDFADNLISLMDVLPEYAQKYPLYYTETAMEQLRSAVRFYSSEMVDDTPLDDSFSDDYVSYLWYALEQTANIFQKEPPKDLTTSLNAGAAAHSGSLLQKKLLQMYTWDQASAKTLSKEGTLATWVRDKKRILPNWTREDLNDIDLLSSEWTCLEIILKAITMIQKSSSNTFQFAQQNSTPFAFFNCSPHNFLIKKSSEKKPEGSWGWAEFKRYFKNSVHLQFHPCVDDSRYDCLFYNSYGTVSFQKRQVCSIATLLVTLLSNDISFSPLFNRRDPIDRKYTYILRKIDGVGISSYTRAILIGALSDRQFERNNFSVFDDMLSNRDDDMAEGPIIVEDLYALKMHILAAQKHLEHFQLSLQDQAPRQLIPLSLKGFSRIYYPGLEG